MRNSGQVHKTVTFDCMAKKTKYLSIVNRKTTKCASFFMHNPTWQSDIVVVIGHDKPAALKCIKKWFPDFSSEDQLPVLGEPGCPTARTLSTGGHQHVVWFKYYPEKIYDYGTIVHELFHVVDVTLRYKGVTLSDDSDESYAYFMQWIYMEFLSKLK